MSPRIAMNDVLAGLAEQGLTEEAARRSLYATIAVLGERLVADEARALAEVLPGELAESVAGVEYDSDFSADELFERVRRRMHTTPGRAREDAEIVLSVLGDLVSRDRRLRIARGLPEQAAQIWLGSREVGAAPSYRSATGAPAGSTLASARPGSTNPLSEAAGLTQERLGETLAAGHPGSDRSIADAGRTK